MDSDQQTVSLLTYEKKFVWFLNLVSILQDI